MMSVQLPLGTLPVNLVLVPHCAGAVFVKTATFSVVLDVDYEGQGNVEGYFYKDSFQLGNDIETAEEFFYNQIYQYKEIPVMLQWLKQQKLQQPDF
jgi:hypothetical protein